MGPAQRREAHDGHKKAAKDARTILAKLALREIHEEDVAAVHNPPKAKVHLRGHQDAPDGRIGEQRAELVLNRRNHFELVAVGVPLELHLPEGAHRLIPNVGGNALAKRFIGVEPQDVRKRRAVTLKQRVKGIAQHMLHAHAPSVRPELAEGLKQA